MSLKSSGIWCDLCHNPILSGGYWDIGFSVPGSADKVKGHSCNKCAEQFHGEAEPEPSPAHEMRDE